MRCFFDTQFHFMEQYVKYMKCSNLPNVAYRYFQGAAAGSTEYETKAKINPMTGIDSIILFPSPNGIGMSQIRFAFK